MLQANKGPAKRRLSAAARVAAVIATAAAISGCQDYLDRRDTITYGIGDSVAVNKTAQTIERWPRASQYDRLTTDGEYARVAADKYRKRDVKLAPPQAPGEMKTSGP